MTTAIDRFGKPVTLVFETTADNADRTDRVSTATTRAGFAAIQPASQRFLTQIVPEAVGEVVSDYKGIYIKGADAANVSAVRDGAVTYKVIAWRPYRNHVECIGVRQ